MSLSTFATTGYSVSGQCLMIGQPFVGQSHGGGFVYEGDHTGGQIRTAAESAHPPWQSDAIMVTNHNMIRGCEHPYGKTESSHMQLWPSVHLHCAKTFAAILTCGLYTPSCGATQVVRMVLDQVKYTAAKLAFHHYVRAVCTHDCSHIQHARLARQSTISSAIYQS